MAQLFERLGTGLEAGLDPLTLWRKEAQRSHSRLGRAAATVADRIRSGDTLAEAMAAADGAFPKPLIEMVAVGEETGRLGRVCLQLAEELQHRLALRRQFIQVITWPLIELALALLAIAGMLWLLELLLADPPFGRGALRRYLLAVATAATGFALVVIAIVQGWFNGLLTRIAMRIPVIGPTLHAGAMARLTWTLASALDAGVDARRAARLALESTGNFMYIGVVGQAVEAIQRGHAFHEALEQTGIFKEDFLHCLSVAELSGTQAESLWQLAKEYQHQFQQATRVLATAAGVAIWTAIAVAIIATIFFLAQRLYFGPVNQLLDEIS